MKLLLQNDLEAGDILMMTAAVRELHASHPGRFLTAVETSHAELWNHNPHVTPLGLMGVPDRVIECAYPLVNFANGRPYHFIHGFIQHLDWRLGITTRVTKFAGDVHLSAREREPIDAWQMPGLPARYWVVVAGGKFDFTAKWWSPKSYQRVVDHFRGRIRFVQCGAAGHWHPPLSGVTNLVGRTTLRDFVRLAYHADGVLCPVTFAMHLSAALPLRPGQVSRPCVVVAGGREPVQWEMYPGHQFMHTQGALDCCATGGCWKSRCQPVGDGDPKDADLCVRPVEVTPGLVIPACMNLVTPERVIDAIELYYKGGAVEYDAH